MTKHAFRRQEVTWGNVRFTLLIFRGVGAAIVAAVIAAFRLTSGTQAYTILRYETTLASLRRTVRIVSGIALAGFGLLPCGSALAQQVMANGANVIVTASGTIDTTADSEFGLYALNEGVIQSDDNDPLTVTTSGQLADAARAERGGEIHIANGSSITASGDSASGLSVKDAGSNITAANTSITSNLISVQSTGNSTMTLDNCIVEGQIGVYVSSGGFMELTNGSVSAFNTLSETNAVFGANSKINADGTTFISTNNNSAAIAIYNGGAGELKNISVINTGPGFHLYGNNGNGGTLELTNSEITTSGDSAFGIYMSAGNLTMTDGAIKTSGLGASAVVGYSNNISTAVITGASLISEQGAGIGGGIAVAGTGNSATLNATLVHSSVIGGTALFDVINSNTLNLTASAASSLTGRALTAGSASSNFTLEGNTVWNLNGDSSVTHLTNNASTINFTASGGDPTDPANYKTLTVSENYNSDSGVFDFNTWLGGDHSPTDKIIINGAVTGATQININPVAPGNGTQTTSGIVLVEVVGGNATPNAFTLGNSPLIAGDYEYELVPVIQGANRLFVLQSKLRAGGGSSATAIPALPVSLLLMLAFLILPAGTFALRRREFSGG